MSEMTMALFPYEGQSTVGVIVQGEGYTPSSTGVTLYLNAGEDLQQVLSKVEESGGKILTPKTPHADESGFFALFIDTEGNRLGLHSPK
ncbi:VOC family protein [Pseudoalteromonas sp. DY56-GL79]|uniref:VOC family protein n=1 Tax=Pseudoalteromonas sp. DY56-GL79 TaxID=2967131 RepID=UPI003529E3BC